MYKVVLIQTKIKNVNNKYQIVFDLSYNYFYSKSLVHSQLKKSIDKFYRSSVYLLLGIFLK